MFQVDFGLLLFFVFDFYQAKNSNILIILFIISPPDLTTQSYSWTSIRNTLQEGDAYRAFKQLAENCNIIKIEVIENLILKHAFESKLKKTGYVFAFHGTNIENISS